MSSASPATVRNTSLSGRESHRIPTAKLPEFILMLEAASQKSPPSADLLTCLGIALAANFHVGKSLESFQAAISLDARHFFARFKYAELLFRLNSLAQAREETKKAIELAGTKWEVSMANRQLQEIARRVRQDVN